MAQLAVELANAGNKVVLIAENEISEERSSQGWDVPKLQNVDVKIIRAESDIRKLLNNANTDTIHICQGIRANGRVSLVQRILRERSTKYWVVMETVDDSGWQGLIKRVLYRILFLLHKPYIAGYLANGFKTKSWIMNRGVSGSIVFSFAYFLPAAHPLEEHSTEKRPFRYLYVGQFIKRKRVDWLITSLAKVSGESFELWIAGGGAEKSRLEALTTTLLPGKVRWLGQIPIAQVPKLMAQVDCLVLPSVHDGWGAVASEALISGTPVVCSDKCGVAGVVKASRYGGVFPVRDRNSFTKILQAQLSLGQVSYTQRLALMSWASCLTAAIGADYLKGILLHRTRGSGIAPKPIEPWCT